MARVDASWRNWRTDHQLWVELFVLANFAGLVVDIFLAHSANNFRRDSEYIPLYFSIAATIALAVAVALHQRYPAVWRHVGHVVGWLAVLVGLAGVILHLDSQFFHERTIRSLTYAAPFAAPLAFTGVGLLLILNRLVSPETREWAQWVLLLALGGFVGNFIFSLTDHAQNGFFNPIEWLPVISSAFAIGFLIVPFVTHVNTAFLRVCVAILILQGLVGILGFVLHSREMLRHSSGTLLDRVLNGPPPLAPLLFPNLVILGLIALWAMHVRDTTTQERGAMMTP
jgi:hypothetical protein